MTQTAITAKSSTWKRLHFVYFLLGALSIGALGFVSHVTRTLNDNFQSNVEAAELGDEIYDHVNNILLRTTDLALVLRDGQSNSSAAAYQERIATLAREFEVAVRRPFGFDDGEEEDEEKGESEDTEALVGSHISEAVAEAGDGRHHAPPQLSEIGQAEFNRIDDLVHESAEVLLVKTKALLLAMTDGTPGPVVDAVEDVQHAIAVLNDRIIPLAEVADSHVDASLKKSGSIFAWVERVEYLVFGLMFIIVISVLLYGIKVGRVLRRTFEQLEVAEAESRTHAVDLRYLNNQMVATNLKLHDNMQKLETAQKQQLKAEKMVQLGELTATVAHELRNPLGAVRTSAFLLERKIKGKGIDVQTQVERINKGINRCDNIITQLLDFSRSKHLDCAPEDLDSMLADVLEEESRKLPPALTISCELGLAGATLPFDPTRMQRAIVNLIANASEALVGTGNSPTQFYRPDPQIQIITAFSGGGVTVEVRDNGPGIPPEVLARIREPLFTTKSFGTGLGVPAVEQIALQHGGRLDIESVAGSGASFKIWLPLVTSTEDDVGAAA
jgi:signal transduction histidine kinase